MQLGWVSTTGFSSVTNGFRISKYIFSSATGPLGHIEMRPLSIRVRFASLVFANTERTTFITFLLHTKSVVFASDTGLV